MYFILQDEITYNSDTIEVERIFPFLCRTQAISDLILDKLKLEFKEKYNCSFIQKRSEFRAIIDGKEQFIVQSHPIQSLELAAGIIFGSDPEIITIQEAFSEIEPKLKKSDNFVK